MGTNSKSVNTDSLSIEVKADCDVAIHGSEIQTVAPHPNRVIPFADNSRNSESSEVTEQFKAADHVEDVAGNKAAGHNLNPAHARWLAIGEKIGAMLTRLKG